MMTTSEAVTNRDIRDVLLEMALTKLQYVSADLADLRVIVAELQGLPNDDRGETPASVYIDAESVGPFEKGFYPREFDEQGRPFRWTGKSEFVEFRFYINRNTLNSFAINGNLPEGFVLGPIRAFADYLPIELNVTYDSDRFVLTGEIPRAPFETRATLTFWSPSRVSLGHSEDLRPLWFIFTQLTVIPCTKSDDTSPETMASAETKEALARAAHHLAASVTETLATTALAADTTDSSAVCDVDLADRPARKNQRARLNHDNRSRGRQ